ncbi:hypothetical protein FOCG_17445 [Fusarium oxysporum f. sp. radicis-lycopersici 26381]|nr:hypothetical protein FOCG_17445 [Fusarium oxysporum f. sp. radicis-lycopersici 26381]
MSPLGEFLSLLAYGRALHGTEGPVYHFHWSEDGEVLSWDGNAYLSMTSFRGLAREALGQATKQSRRLMYEWEPLDPNFNSIRDRLSMATANLWDEFEEAAEAAEAVVAGQAREKGLTDEKMERLCLGMLIGMLDHQFKQSHYDSIVLCALAIMGINEDGGWIEPTDYTPKYSGVIKVARMLVLYQSWHEREEDVAEKMRTMSENEAREKAKGMYRIVREKSQRFIIRICLGLTSAYGECDYKVNTVFFLAITPHKRSDGPGSGCSCQ